MEVILDADRDEYGQATLLHESGFVVFGPVPVLGRSTGSERNPDADPLLPYGNTPTGTYESWVRSTEERNSRGEVYSQVRSRSGKLSYGSSGLLVLRPESGQAKRAELNGRSGLLIHAGELGDNFGLRPTAGCLRLYPDDMKQLVSYIAHYRSTITAEISIGTVTVDLPPPYARNEPDTAAVDPPPMLEFSDPWEDEWTKEMWDAILKTDQDIETGGLIDRMFVEGYYDPSSRLEDMASHGRDMERAAQHGGFDIAPEIERGRGNTSGTSNVVNDDGNSRAGRSNGNSGDGGDAAPECPGPANVICIEGIFRGGR